VRQPTDTVALGAGPVGQMAIRSAILLGARQVVVIDRVPERLAMARAAGVITINFDEESVLDRLKDLTNGKGPVAFHVVFFLTTGRLHA
jgi:threonine dehydrogenase-like Zn-dependent dehydrogenase